jgi:hypothetical protein
MLVFGKGLLDGRSIGEKGAKLGRGDARAVTGSTVEVKRRKNWCLWIYGSVEWTFNGCSIVSCPFPLNRSEDDIFLGPRICLVVHGVRFAKLIPPSLLPYHCNRT